jgi:ABC-type multidrug transport system permease subunit
MLMQPTSGLDARGALVIMRAMKRIADTGRTVCATIHQPSAAVFEMFDDLLLLQRGGEVVFFGELGQESCLLVEYFESMGADPIKHGENPAAWMLRAYTHEGDERNWKDLFEGSEQYQILKESLASLRESLDESKRIAYSSVFAASNHTQQILMMRRIFRIMMRSPSYNLARLMIAVFYSLLIGTVFVRSQNKGNVFSQYQVDGILSTIFLGLIIIGVVSISMSVPVMKQIRDVFYKHRASGMLAHNSVTLAVTLGELPYLVMISAIFSSVYYALVGLFGTANKWFSFFLYFGLNMATYTYFGQAFICLVKDIPTAGALVGALIGYNVFFSGLVVRPQYFSGPFQLGKFSKTSGCESKFFAN